MYIRAGAGPCGPPWALVGGTLVGPLGPCGPPWALVGRTLAGPLGHYGPGPCGPPWALMGRALVASLGPCGTRPCGPPWALMGRALVGPPGPLWGGPLRAPPGPLWAGPLWAPLGPHGPGPCGRPGLLWARPLWAPWALMGRALMGTLVNQRLGSMANPLNLLATLKWHKAIYLVIPLLKTSFSVFFMFLFYFSMYLYKKWFVFQVSEGLWGSKTITFGCEI